MPYTLPPEQAKELVIEPWPGGFFAGFMVVLNHLGWCKKHDKNVIVNWGEGSPYYQKAAYYGTTANAWEYYFEPVSNLSYDASFYRSWEYTLGDPNFHYCSLDQESRNLAYELICEFITIKEHIQHKVDYLYQRYMANKKTIGIHVRGTDKVVEEKLITPEMIVTVALSYADADTQFLIASDEQQLVNDIFLLLHGYDVLCYPCKRSLNKQPLHLNPQEPAQAGEDVLIEVLLLSKCNMMVHSLSNVSTAALYFNPHLEHIAVSV